ncbi:GNAT family N-acetyltransferase [Sphingobacterium sp. LRF_L2]|uniref:GNAT family N-acetyltransferase n=1 Tax=Sphingobacterium sp. LRF_L2 TaxID=3369421 RepID=UPI003F5EF74C
MSMLLKIEQVAAPVTWSIRQQVLYPNGSLRDVMIDGDFEALHFGAYYDNELVGVISLFEEDQIFQFRKFAVLQKYQRQGIGRQLLKHLIATARSWGIKRIWCNARREAVGFYRQFGLEISDEPFYKNGIEYVRMEATV